MKKIRIHGFLLLSMIITMNLSAQTPSPEKLTVPLTNPGKPYALKVSILSGSIKVSSYEGKDILIEVSARNKNKNEITEDSNNVGMRRITPKNSFDITAREDNNDITIDNNNNDRNKTIDLILKIPQDVKLKLSTVNSGEIEVENIKGELEVNNVNGAIKLTNISGSAVATTVNGNLTASFNTIDPKAPMAFTTLNGNVDITFPATVKSNLRLKSERGEIYTDFEIDIDKGEHKAGQTSQSGMYQLKLDDWVAGKINGGGPEILMKNMNGNIYVRKSK
jgi:DUF4097 and DUF4098 domain-containing protein YvlB